SEPAETKCSDPCLSVLAIEEIIQDGKPVIAPVNIRLTPRVMARLFLQHSKVAQFLVTLIGLDQPPPVNRFIGLTNCRIGMLLDKLRPDAVWIQRPDRRLEVRALDSPLALPQFALLSVKDQMSPQPIVADLVPLAIRRCRPNHLDYVLNDRIEETVQV